MTVEVCTPTLIVKGVTGIAYDLLPKRGIKVLCFDLENTLEPLHCKRLRKDTVDFLEELNARGFKICIATNNTGNFSYIIGQLETAGVDVVMVQPSKGSFGDLDKGPKKPSPEFWELALYRLKQAYPDAKLEFKQMAMIGDKLMADVSGAMNVGMVGILVNPLGPDLRLERLFCLRPRENILLKSLGAQRA
jgi:HAD superfamily phosphatase (TIGR01668 family)